jgi:hypothetical protein
VAVEVRAARWAVCVLLAGCGGAQQAPESPRAAPAAAHGESQSPSDEGTVWRARIDASTWSTATPGDEGTVTLEAKLGGKESLRCVVHAGRASPASEIAKATNRVRDASASAELQLLDVQVVNGSTALYARLPYIPRQGHWGDTPEPPTKGELQVAVYAHDEHPVVCVLREPGYEKAFRDATSGLFVSVSGPAPSPEPDFLEVDALRSKGVLVGFYLVCLRREGGHQVLTQATSLITYTDHSFSDEMVRFTVDAAGRLVSGTYTLVDAGQSIGHVAIARQQGATYSYEGDFQSIGVKGTFQASNPAGVGTGVSFARALAAASRSRAFEVTDDDYYPSAQQPTPIAVVGRHQETDPQGFVSGAWGIMKYTGLIDESGRLELKESSVEGMALEYERKVVRGKL